MAQHIPIEAFKQKKFQNIKKAIIKEFATNRYIKGSLKYIYEKDISNFHAVDKNDEVFILERYIGKGYIWGTSTGSFEIHFDKAKRKVTAIYLVA